AAAHAALGDRTLQLRLAEEALALAPPGTASARALALNVLANCLAAAGRVTEAEVAFREAAAAYLAAGDHGGRVRVLHNWGLAFAMTGAFGRAILRYREAIHAAQSASRLPLAMSYNNLALCLQYLGRGEEAQAMAEEGMTVAERLGARRDRVFLLWTLGYVRKEAGEPLRSRDHFEASLAEAGAIGDLASEVNAHAGLAELLVGQGRLDEAQVAIDRAVAVAGTTIDDPALLECTLLQAELAIRQGDAARGGSLLEHIEAHLLAAPNAYGSFHVARLRRMLCESTGDAGAAARWAECEAELAAEHGYPAAGRAGEPGASPVAQEAGIVVRFLGAPDVSVAGRRLTARDWRTANARLVLAYLLGKPDGATKEDLLELLYPGKDPDRSALHVVIGRLRKALEPEAAGTSHYILFRDGRYSFNRGVHLEYDVADFRSLLRDARSADPARRRDSLAAALDRYRGPFMPEFGEVPWCQIEAENLRRQVGEACEALFSLAAAADDWAGLEAYADRAVALEPAWQAAYRAKVVALAFQDRLPDAARMAETARSVLARSLVPDLEPETEELFARVADGRLTVKAARAALPGASGY
ncbi:MAG: tetratricopeptide repeat protein, partial [Candidatus Sericytochromatia bacterium]|nr:tetratricopeptide repeat protein [Candidatus Tanganyikabacteria bacterium]